MNDYILYLALGLLTIICIVIYLRFLEAVAEIVRLKQELKDAQKSRMLSTDRPKESSAQLSLK